MFLTLAAGSIIYVIAQLLGVAAKAKRPTCSAYGLLIGLIAGFLTDAIVSAGRRLTLRAPVSVTAQQPYGAAVTDDDLWSFYDKDQLPHGWSYPLGRDRIAKALREAGANLGSLNLSSPGEIAEAAPGQHGIDVLRVRCVGDGQARYHGGNFTFPSRLHMYLNAVPVDVRGDIGRLLESGALQRACSWSVEAATRGNVWLSTSHEFVACYRDGRLQVSETWLARRPRDRLPLRSNPRGR